MFQQILNTTRPTAALKRTLWDDVKKVARSSNEISRVVHTNSHRHWSDSEDLALATRFNVVVLEKAGQGRTYKQASKAQRKLIIETLSLEFHRSPIAIIIRAKGLNLIAASGPIPVVPTAGDTAMVAPAPQVDETTAAILAIIAAQNVAATVQPPQAEATVAPSVAVTSHAFGNTKLRSMYSA